MKNLKDILVENKVDDAIENALSMMNTIEDIEALGESFGNKYSKDILHSLEEFVDGVEIVMKDQKFIDKVSKIRQFITSLK